MATREATLAILSGKGGTGKTLLAVNLASVAQKSTYIDCDVEEPNGNLYFKPKNSETLQVTVKKPVVDENLCNGCHACVDFCAFNALALIGKRLMIFEEICHSCGGCMLVCPQKALSEANKEVGTIKIGNSGPVKTLGGTMNIGESSGVPIIRQLLGSETKGTTFIDCPPGSSCLVMESIKDADFCLLVAEPTTFGVHNLAMVYELVTLLGKKHAVVLNKCMEGENPAETFCQEKGILIAGRIPFDKKLGILHSQAMIAAREDGNFKRLFSSILETIGGELGNETVAIAQR
ncbi:P-loop ATPase, MinD superfamily [Sphaerochaeta pleomorpha str. Grapes]|uniref:p-loop ATPase, MinD superfamily n=2 Tax=Sphaerochaeta TaxID=399320 RepID=G8QTY1_SPHPG|nr:P-loop ATPase, MinD superfamily [Sphaerochaeta pleomorpha str. Grapes]